MTGFQLFCKVTSTFCRLTMLPYQEMASAAVDQMLLGREDPKGFSFENCRRCVHIYYKNALCTCILHFLKSYGKIRLNIQKYFSRNAFMAKQGVSMPKARSTGTTICGVIFNVSCHLNQ